MFAVGGNALTWVAAVLVIIATIGAPIFAIMIEIERDGANPETDDEE